MRSITERVYISTSCVDGDRNILSVLDRLSRLAITNIELSGPHPHMPYPKLVQELLKYKKAGMSFLVHNYFPQPESDFVLNIASHSDDIRERSYQLICSALELSQTIGAPFYGCHAGYLADAMAEEEGYFKFDMNTLQSPESCQTQTVRMIQALMNKNNNDASPVTFLLENLFPAGPERTFSLACTPGDIKAMIRAVDNPKVGWLLDLAHLELTCNLYNMDTNAALDEVIDSIGHLVRCVHVSGQNGKTDTHAPLEPDAWQLHGLKRLRELPGDGDGIFFTIECRKLNDDTLLSQIDQFMNSLEQGS